jgi:iron complex outermembrane recepter protein
MQYHVEDTLKLFDDKLVVNGGWKGVKVNNSANMATGTVQTLASGKIDTKDWFQPQGGILFHVTPGLEAFADYTENMRAFTSSATTGPFSTTQAGFDAIAGQLKPERSKTYEGGLRFRHGPLQASAVGYYVDFSNRLLSFANGAGILGNPATLQNVGSVHTYGAELSVNYRIFDPLSIFASYSYNNSKYEDDVFGTAVVGGVTTPVVLAATKGMTVVDSPKNMVKGEIVYDDGQFTGRIGADYMTKRYFTYLNDESVPSRVLVDASIGYKLKSANRWLDGLSIEASVTNLTDRKYIATVGSNGFTASGDNQTLLAGAPRQWFVTLKRGF